MASEKGGQFDLQAEMAKYQTHREELIAAEKSLRHDYDFRQRMSPTAQKAAAVVQSIRNHEAKAIWSKEHEAADEVFPGMSFTLAKDRIEQTKLWKIVKKLPKGAMLHAHLEAMVDMHWLLDRALETSGLHIFSSVPLTSAKALEKAVVQFTYSTETVKSSAGLYSTDYTPDTLIPIHTAVADFPANLLTSHTPGGKSPEQGFREWFISRTTITPEESMLHHEGIDKVWDKFQSTFRVVNGIIYYEPIYRAFVRHVLESLYADGGAWADIRSAFLMNFRAANTGEVLPRHEVLRVFGEVVDEFVKETNGDFWGARMIWTQIRSFEPELIVSSMKECIDAKQRHPKYLSGFDLVGQEDMGRSYISHLPELLQFRKMCADAGVEIPLYLHAGETLGDGDETDENLFDALLLGAKRIGHGYSMYKHPHLMNLCKTRGVCLEVCPISNEILRLTSSIMGHSLPAVLAQGVPVALSNDDPGILGQKTTSSLSHDYWQVLQAFKNVGLEGLGDLAETGVKYAAFDTEGEVGTVVPGGLREERLKDWRNRWEGFCEWVVEEFSDWETKEK